MDVYTDTPEIHDSRKQTLELICSNHRFDCEYCSRYSDCELQALMRLYGVDEKKLIYGESGKEAEYDASAAHLACLNGGAQPRQSADFHNFSDLTAARTRGL